MKRWMVAVAAVGLTVGVAGPVAAKTMAPKAPAATKVVVAPTTKAAPSAAAPVLPKHDRSGGGYPGPTQPKISIDGSYVRQNRRFKVKVEHFCERGTVALTLNPTQPGWPKSLSTNRYGSGETYVDGIAVKGTYTLTGTCDSYSASINFRVK